MNNFIARTQGKLVMKAEGSGELIMETNNTLVSKSLSKEELDLIIEKHKMWLNNESDGECADLSWTDLSDYDLVECDLRYANMRGCSLRNAKLIGAHLQYADLSNADLTGARLGGSELNHTDLSGAIGLPSAIDTMNKLFEQCESGYIAYKTFNSTFFAPLNWELKEGSIISENVAPDRTSSCGCGINIGTYDWVNKNTWGQIWMVLIPWGWLSGVVVPYNTTGKIRCERVRLIKKVERVE